MAYDSIFASLPVTARYSLIEQEGGQWFLTDLLHPRNARADARNVVDLAVHLRR